MNKAGKILVSATVVVALAAAGVTGWKYWDESNTLLVDGVQYRRGTSLLDLREEEISLTHYRHLQEAFPGREILWSVPFQMRSYANDTEKITVTSLTKEDVKQLELLPELQYVDARNCFDYEALQALRAAKPRCIVDSCVAIAGKIYPYDTEKLEFAEGQEDFEELLRKLAYLPSLKEVHFTEPTLTPQELQELEKTFAEVTFTWDKTLFGKHLSRDTKTLDISGRKFKSIEDVKAQTDYLPELTKLTMCNTGLPYDDIAAFRERSSFKVIFNVRIRDFDVRTDAVWFMPSKFGKEVRDCDMRNLKYCEDMQYVDLSRNVVKNIDWVRGTPHLKYLVIKESPLRDLQFLRDAKELRLLEISNTDLRELEPLQGCTALEDLNLSGFLGDISALREMDWLQNLWAIGGDSLKNQLPDTNIHGSNEGGWKQLKNYREMQELLEKRGPTLIKK